MVQMSAAKLGYWDRVSCERAREEAVVLGGHHSSPQRRALMALSVCLQFSWPLSIPDVGACVHRISSAPEEQVLLNTSQ